MAKDEMPSFLDYLTMMWQLLYFIATNKNASDSGSAKMRENTKFANDFKYYSDKKVEAWQNSSFL